MSKNYNVVVQEPMSDPFRGFGDNLGGGLKKSKVAKKGAGSGKRHELDDRVVRHNARAELLKKRQNWAYYSMVGKNAVSRLNSAAKREDHDEDGKDFDAMVIDQNHFDDQVMQMVDFEEDIPQENLSPFIDVGNNFAQELVQEEVQKPDSSRLGEIVREQYMKTDTRPKTGLNMLK
jgi:hypothetical protein